jgi:biotin carboxylase
MRVLLTDGSGLTARQVATQLSLAGHEVHVLTADPLALTRFTRHVRRLHQAPPYGPDPFRWLDAALAVFEAGAFDVLFPTQEQVAVLAKSAKRLREAGVATAVPSFEALIKLQNKLAMHSTLEEVGLPQPQSAILTTAAELRSVDSLPVFVKAPIGTASTGVRHVADATQMKALADLWHASGMFADGGVLVQAPVAGPLVMIQSVFSGGELLAAHANLRVREGASGGASHKISVDLPIVREQMLTLGRHLGWHGALSADAILTDSRPVYIDINPRLVEPGNAWRAGVDLVGALLNVALGKPQSVQPPGRSGVATHQLLLALLGAAQQQNKRLSVLSELVSAYRQQGGYHGSTEELTPIRHDPRSAIPVVASALATLARPAAWRWFSSGAVSNYALTPAGWRAILASGQNPHLRT